MKVYVVVGFFNGNDSYYILSRYGVKSTLEKAQEELKIIKREILEELENNNIDVNSIEIKENDTRLTIIYGNDDVELYQIEERELDYE